MFPYLNYPVLACLRMHLGGTVYRVNWLRAKCRSDRWSEELTLAKSELEWTRLCFQRRAQKWDDRVDALALLDSQLQYYGRRQAKTWRLLQSKVENAIKESSTKLGS